MKTPVQCRHIREMIFTGMSKALKIDRSRVTLTTVDAEESGQRIDNYLVRVLKGVPKSHIYRILRKGEVRVNKGRVRPQYKLAAGDMVRIPPVRVADRPITAGRHPGLQDINERILFENKRLMAINKPAGMAVHGGSGISHGIIEALRAEWPDAPYLELVHRLDRETSGCLLIARRRSALRNLHEQLREGRVKKTYLALVRGQWQGGRREVSAPLRKNQLKSGERMVRVDPEGKEAITIFTPVSVFKEASLMEVELKTGRTHQIRVHAAHCDHPLAGDPKYGDDAFNKAMRKYGLRRLFLHASMLEFTDPGQDEVINVSAPLPDVLKSVLDCPES